MHRLDGVKRRFATEIFARLGNDLLRSLGGGGGEEAGRAAQQNGEANEHRNLGHGGLSG